MTAKDKSLYEALRKQVTELRKMSLLPETPNGQDKRLKNSQKSPEELENYKKLRRLLTSIRQGEFHTDRICKIPSEKDFSAQITQMIEEGEGEDIVRHMVEIARLNKKLLHPNSIEILAICAGAPLTKLSPNSRQNLKLLSYEALQFICETPAELTKFVSLYDELSNDKKGADMLHRKAVQNWYTSKTAWELAKLMSLCDDSGHKDMLKKLNPRKTGCGQLEFQNLLMAITLGCQADKNCLESPITPAMALANKNVRRQSDASSQVAAFTEFIFAAEAIKTKLKHTNEAIELIRKHNLELDHMPASLLYSKEIWKALLPGMSLSTLLRAISRIASFKLLSLDDLIRLSDSYFYHRSFDESHRRWRDASVDSVMHQNQSETFIQRYKHMAMANEVKDTTEAIQIVIEKLEKAEFQTESAVVTSFNLLIACAQYSNGRTGREMWSAYISYWSSYSRNFSFWTVNPKICRSLESAYSRCVKLVEPTGKRFLILIDCSPSMDCNYLSTFQLTARVFLGVLLQFLVDTEDHCEIHSSLHRISSKFPYAKGWKADQITSHSSKAGYSLIDVTQFVEWAQREAYKADVLMVISDDGIDYRGTSPHKVLNNYRKTSGVVDAKLITLQLTNATRKVASNDDLGTLDCHGFDYDTIEILRAFVMDLI